MSEEDVIRMKEQIKTLFEADKRQEKCYDELKNEFQQTINLIFEKLDGLSKQLQNRLPLWATMLIALLTAICGWSLAK